MEELFVDLVVIGSGPAGQKAAIQAAKLGKSVVIIVAITVIFSTTAKITIIIMIVVIFINIHIVIGMIINIHI